MAGRLLRTALTVIGILTGQAFVSTAEACLPAALNLIHPERWVGKSPLEMVECADLLDLPPIREQLERYPTIDFREDGIWFEVERTTIPRNGRPSPGYVITWCEHTGNEDCTAQMRFIFDRVGTVGICASEKKGNWRDFVVLHMSETWKLRSAFSPCNGNTATLYSELVAVPHVAGSTLLNKGAAPESSGTRERFNTGNCINGQQVIQNPDGSILNGGPRC